MTVAVEAIYEDGVLKLEQPVPFKEHARVRVTIEEDAAQAPREDAPELGAWEGLIGCIESGPTDVSEKQDEYLYRRER